MCSFSADNIASMLFQKQTHHKNDVFEEVPDTGPNSITVQWVITEKVKDGKIATKARLVARGFEEDSSDIPKDAPICSREAVRILVCIAGMGV